MGVHARPRKKSRPRQTGPALPRDHAARASLLALRRLLHPAVDLLLGLLLLVAVALLQAAGELLALAVDQRDVVVSELAPLLAQLAFRLGPVAFDLVPIHVRFPPITFVCRAGR